MSWELNNEKPIFIQLEEKIKRDIINGVYPPGSKLPTVRELAFDASVNPNTMQKALINLEKDNLVITQRTTGRFVTNDNEIIENVKESLSIELSRNYINSLLSLGYKKEEAVKVLEKYINTEEGQDDGK